MNNFFFIRMQLNIMYNIWVTCKITLYTLLLLIAIHIIVIFHLVTKMHGLEIQRKHKTIHYLCWDGFIQNMGSISSRVLYLPQINQYEV